MMVCTDGDKLMHKNACTVRMLIDFPLFEIPISSLCHIQQYFLRPCVTVFVCFLFECLE